MVTETEGPALWGSRVTVSRMEAGASNGREEVCRERAASRVDVALCLLCILRNQKARKQESQHGGPEEQLCS